jgi:cytochrome c oxidase subunit 1
MAIVERPATPSLELPSGPLVTDRPLGAFTRPQATTGWKSWLTTVDHKRIGIMYGASALVFFILGGLEALMIRLQLTAPDSKLYSADLYNQIFTMHGVTMIFLVVMPMGAAFMNYLMPLQIGARDVAFPRLNAFSFWTFLFGGLFLNTSWFLGGGADGGWFAYAPNTSVTFSPGHGMDFYALGLQITGIASLVGAINLIVTVLNMRAPGMSLM